MGMRGDHMSIYDDEIEYQQWREEKEDWEMTQEEKQNCDRVDQAMAEIAENIQIMEGRELKDCLCQVDIIGLIREKPYALQFDEDRVGLLQAEIAGLKQGIAKHNAQVAELNETIENLRAWRAETVFGHQQEVDGLKAKIADYVHVQEELKSTIRDYRQEATGRDIETTNYRAAFKTLRKMIQEAPELNMRNYSVDQVAELNHAVIRMACFCDEVERS